MNGLTGGGAPNSNASRPTCMLTGNGQLGCASVLQQRHTAACKRRMQNPHNSCNRGTCSQTARNSGLSRKSPCSCRTIGSRSPSRPPAEDDDTKPLSPCSCAHDWRRDAQMYLHANDCCGLHCRRFDHTRSNDPVAGTVSCGGPPLQEARKAMSTNHQQQLIPLPTSSPSEATPNVPCLCSMLCTADAGAACIALPTWNICGQCAHIQTMHVLSTQSYG
jgi:hypothetical protein